MNNENIEEILKNIGTGEIPADIHKIAQETSNNFTSSLKQTRRPKRLILLEQIMKRRITKLAAAAVIFVAVLAGWPLLDDKHGVALADVLAKIEQAQAFMYKMDMTMTGSMIPGGKRETQTTMIISNEYGMKYETDMGIPDSNTGKTMTRQIYILPDQKVMLLLMHEQKKFMRVELDDDMLARTKKQNNDPREMMKQILGCKYTELGRSEINGIEVEGFETTDPKFSAGITEEINMKLWVDVKTKLPVLWEMDMKMNEQTSVHGVISDYQWDVPVVASDFDPVIPEDYTSLTEDGYKMPSMTEEGALEGLKLFVDMSGQYPKKIDMMSLMREFMALKAGEGRADALKLKEKAEQIAKGQDRTEAARELKELVEQTAKRQDGIKASVAKTVEMMRPIQSLAMFYMLLVQDEKEPAYYGETVGPNDVDAVLMRWKVSDGQYRVVFGDLLTSNVTAEELAELEKFSIDDGHKMPSMTEEAALEDKVKSPAIDYYDRGEAHYFDGEYDQAFSELTRAIEIDPGFAPAYIIRGIAYNDKGEHDLSIADFTRVIEIKPTDAHAYVSRGMAYGNKGEYDLAVADHSRAIEIDPTLTDPYRLRARAYTYKGEYDKAWKDVYQAQALGRPVDPKLLEKLRKASGRDE